MCNSTYKLLKDLKKSASAMGAGSFMPPQPLPNSIKAKQIEQEEMAAQQADAGAGAGNEQMMQMQKAQEDAVNQLQQAQQQLAQTQGELQNVQMQTQQQMQQMQMDAQQQINKAQMDAEYKMQEEKIKNQQKLLSVQEKYTKAMGKNPPNQSPILVNQLKRLNKKVNNLKVASQGQVLPPPQPKPISAPSTETPKVINTGITMPSQNSTIQAHEQKKFPGMPHSNVAPSQRSQQQWNEIQEWKKSRYSSDPKMKEIENKVMAAPSKTPGYMSGLGNEISSYWADPKKYMAQNKPFGDGWGGTAFDLLGGFTTNINSGFSNLARGNLGQGLLDLGSGYAQGIGTVGLGAGLVGGAARLGAKALPSAAGSLSRISGAAKNVLPAALQGRKTQLGLLGLSMAPMFLGSNYSDQMDQTAASKQEWDDSWNNTPGMNPGGIGSGGLQFPGGFAAPQPQPSPYTNMTPAQRFGAMNQQALNDMRTMSALNPYMYKSSSEYYKKVTEGLSPEDAKATIDFMKNQKEKGLYSPVPILQRTSYLKPQEFKYDMFNPAGRQGYGEVGDLIRKLIFAFVPSIAPGPDWQRVHGNLMNNQAYRINNSVGYGGLPNTAFKNKIQMPDYYNYDFS